MIISTFTLFHVLLSVAGIGSGFIVVYGLLTGERLAGWIAIFLATTVLTSLTGFLSPVEHLLPSQRSRRHLTTCVDGCNSGALALRLAGLWRWIYVVCAVLALYLNSFVAVVQSFLKVSALKTLAPTQKELPFLVAQLVVMAISIAIWHSRVKKFQLAHITGA